MSDAGSPLKSLSLETKALIIVSEFEARRMPMFQMRAILQAILRDDEERKNIVDLVEKDLRATGYPEAQVATFLSDLIVVSATPGLGGDASITTTRRLRSPFAREFDQGPSAPPPDASIPGAAPGMRGVVAGPLAAEPKPYVKPPSSPILTPAPIPAAPAGPRGSTNVLPPRRPTMGPGGMTLSAPTPPAGSPKVGSGSRHPAQAPTEPLLPAGQKTVLRHDLAFGKVMPSAVPAGAAPATTSSPTNMPPGFKPVILVADDDKRIRMVFRLRLEEAGFSVIEIGDGQEAWNRIEQGGISLLVLDMKMPGLHGLEILSRMVDRQVKLPVIVCSAYDQLENEFVVQTHPNLKYLVKPVAPDALIAAARALLKSS